MGAFSNLFASDVAIDLGTANTIVFVKDQGVVLSEPSVVAVDNMTGKVVAIGLAAKDMIGRTPSNIVATQPTTIASTEPLVTRPRKPNSIAILAS